MDGNKGHNDGDYMVYMVVISQPPVQNATSQPIISSGIHINSYTVPEKANR